MTALHWRPEVVPAQRSRWAACALQRARVELRRQRREPVLLATALGLPVAVQLAAALPQAAHAVTSVAGDSGRLTVGLVTLGIMLCSFATIAVGTCDEVADGTLDRLRGTPLPLTAYVAGKAAMAVLCSLALTLTLLGLAALLTGFALPARPGPWAWIALLVTVGAVAGTGLGLVAAEPPTWMTVPGVYLLVVVLAVTGGLLVDPGRMPLWVTDSGLPFPVRWLGQGLRAELLPGQVTQFDLDTAWGRGPTVTVIAGWAVFGLVQGLRGIRRMRDDAR